MSKRKRGLTTSELRRNVGVTIFQLWKHGSKLFLKMHSELRDSLEGEREMIVTHDIEYGSPTAKILRLHKRMKALKRPAIVVVRWLDTYARNKSEAAIFYDLLLEDAIEMQHSVVLVSRNEREEQYLSRKKS